MSTPYKETQLIKPQDTSFVNEDIGQPSILSDNLNAENLFHLKNLYRDVKSKVIEGPIKTTQIDKITKIPKIIFKERIHEPKKKEKKIVTKEVEIENIIEVPEVKENIIYNEVKVPTYVDVPVIHPRQAIYYQQISKNIPKGVELVVTNTYEVPQIRPKYIEVPVPIYVPCYIEVPMPAHYIPTNKTNEKEYFISGIGDLTKGKQQPLSNGKDENIPIIPNKDVLESFNVHSSKGSNHASEIEQNTLEKLVVEGEL